LFLNCATGKVFPKVEIDFTKPTPNGEVSYLYVTLSNVLVTSVSHATRTAEPADMPAEQVSFNYTKIEFKYTPVDQDTGSTGEPVEVAYDAAQGPAQ
jgi:type VI protein secretion system component Hcp